MAVRARRRHGRRSQAGAERARPRRRRRELRQARANVAVVGDGLAGARAADEGDVVAQSNVDGHVDAVEVLGPAAIPGRIGDEVVDLSGLLGDDVVEARHDVAAPSRQSRIQGGDDAERRQIGRLERQVVDNEKAVETSAGCRSRSPKTAAQSAAESTRRDSSPTDGRPSRRGWPGRSCWSGRSCRSCVFDITPQRSPPLCRRSCAAGFDRSQSGTKFRFASVQARVTPAVPNACVVCGIRSVGLVLA